MAYHDEYVELISAAIDGALSPADQAKLEAHLAQCPHCQALYDDLSRIHQTLRALPTVAVPEGLSDRIIAAVQSDNVIPLPVKRPTIQWKRWAATAAVLALILAGAGGLRLLTGRDIMAPATGEMATPNAIDPAMTRILPEGTPTQDEAPTSPDEDVQATVKNEIDTPSAQKDVTAQGSAVTPAPTATPTFVPAQSNPSTPPNQAPEETEENPSNYMVGPIAQVPVITVPPTPDGHENEDPGIAVQSISLQLEMTEEERAAMEQLRLYLELSDDYEWENGTTAFWTGDEEEFRLVYTRLASDGEEYYFEFWVTPLGIEDPQPVLRYVCVVHTDGSDITLTGTPNFYNHQP